MKKNRLAVVLLAGLLLPGTLFLGGCKNISNAATEWTPPVKTETEDGDEQSDKNKNKSALAREIEYVQDTFTKEDYIRLAENYRNLGLIRMQRDTLEQGYRLFKEEEFLTQLADIAVNLAEEDAAIADEAATMLQNLELSEYLAESLHLAEDEQWFQTMMPKLSEGSRNYFVTKDGKTTLELSVGYDENGVKYTHAWFLGQNDQVLSISYSNRLAQVLETGVADGQYNGEFTLWTINGYNGNILKETGTFAAGTVEEDGHSARIHQGKAAGDVYDLWNNKDSMSYFELKEEDRKARTGLSELAALPAFAVYDPVDTSELQKDEPQVRVYDGQIQYLTDKGWVSLGDAAALTAADPFTAYAAEKKQIDAKVPAERVKEAELKPASGNANNGTTNTNTQNQTQTNQTTTQNRNTTTTQTTTPTTTTPTTTTPTTTTPAPAVTEPTPEPTPAPQPVPVDDDDDDDDDGGNDNGGDNGGNDGGDAGNDGGDNGGDAGNDGGNDGGDDGGNDGGDNGGDDGDNDAEIGWGDDLL